MEKYRYGGVIPHTIDFTESRWGHALHASTWRRVHPTSTWQRLKDWWASRRRYCVLVHCEQVPLIDDMIRYRIKGKGIATAKIYDVGMLNDPPDLFQLYIYRDAAFDYRHNLVREE